MCGFAGFIDTSPKRNVDDFQAIICKMRDAISHRGPDDAGLWMDINQGVALGFRRLSIIDLSPNGHQPMRSACGRYTIVFNGEIYNFKELKTEILKTGRYLHNFRGHSDTEVLLAAFTLWGIEATLPKTNGMFAFAVWDGMEECLTLGRDRIGEKPLYYGLQNSLFVFGSELRSFLQHPKLLTEIDREALSLYFRYSYIPAPFSIYKGIKKLPPGTFIKYSSKLSLSEPVAYWSAEGAIQKARLDPFKGSFDEALSEIEGLLENSVLMRMESDVPLGAFLSGGVDSSTIVSLMQKQSSKPIKTFTIGFHEDAYDEAKYAKKVAAHLGTEHTEMYLTSQDALNVVPNLSEIYDEPFADSSQIPTLLVSRLARKHVTVALSGDAGDELFSGYNRYRWGKSLWNRLKYFPSHLRKPLTQSLLALSPEKWNIIFKGVSPLFPKKYRFSNPGDKIHKVAQVLSVDSREELYLNLVSQWKNPSSLVLNGFEPPSQFKLAKNFNAFSDITEMMMAHDLVTYLPDDILVKVDRASMRESLEGRIPLLDHRLIEFAWRLPIEFKIHNGQTKYILRQLLYKHVPKELIERPKMGFGVPIEHWLRGPLKDWATELMSPELIKRQGYLNSDLVQKHLQEHLSGKRNWQYRLWPVLMFQSWVK